jgi:hypothetical protein
MVRKKVYIRKKSNKVIDAGRAESPKNPVDPEVSEEFADAQQLAGSGGRYLADKLRKYTSSTPEITSGDVDADWEHADIGTETPGGDNPTPDQSVVQDIGEAVGRTHSDLEPLHTSGEEEPAGRNGIPKKSRTPESRRGTDEPSEKRGQDEPIDWE